MALEVFSVYLVKIATSIARNGKGKGGTSFHRTLPCPSPYSPSPLPLGER